MSEEKFYRCIPELNKECKKNNCYINGGECETTIYKKYTLKGLLEEIERLNNIINEIDMMLKTLIMDSDFSNTKLTAQVILMNLNELRGFNKGEDKE